jgi:alpha-ketoglutarate-dependent 2,4-dichlorophenoxyacetate dioxygenase
MTASSTPSTSADLRTQAIGPLPDFAARATGLDLSQPLTDADVRAIEAAMDAHAVLVFPGQQLSPTQQLDFARQFGPLDVGFGKVRGRAHRLAERELGDISNLGLDGGVAARDSQKIIGNIANQLWHSDSSFQHPRAKYSMLYAVEVPAEGGNTEFADLRAAHDRLPGWLREQVRLEGLGAEPQRWRKAKHHPLHSRFMLGDTAYSEEQRQAIEPAWWPLVQTDPRSGRGILYVGAHACEVEGLSLAEGRMLIMDLIEHATQHDFVYRHRWTPGDLVMWDNTATLHRGRAFDLSVRRELRRATTEEVAPATP